jgi:hypothetical protein
MREIGSYENYDDELYGTKTYFALSIMKRDHAASDALKAATAQLQKLEDSLPYNEGKRTSACARHSRRRLRRARRLRSVAKRQHRHILPNDAGPARRYGRTIMLRPQHHGVAGYLRSSPRGVCGRGRGAYVATFNSKGGKQPDAVA